MLAPQHPEGHCFNLYSLAVDEALEMALRLLRVHCVQLIMCISNVADINLSHAFVNINFLGRPGSRSLLAHATIGILVLAN